LKKKGEARKVVQTVHEGRGTKKRLPRFTSGRKRSAGEGKNHSKERGDVSIVLHPRRPRRGPEYLGSVKWSESAGGTGKSSINWGDRKKKKKKKQGRKPQTERKNNKGEVKLWLTV